MNQFLLGLVNVNDMMVLDSFNAYKKVILKALEICDTDITDIEARKEQMPAPVVVPGQTELSYKLVDVLRFKTFHRNQKILCSTWIWKNLMVQENYSRF